MQIEHDLKLADIFATPYPVKLCDGKTYFIHPLSLHDTEELDNFLRATYLREQKTLLEDFDSKERSELLREVLKDVALLSSNSDFGRKYMINNFECCVFFLYLHLRKGLEEGTDYDNFKESVCMPQPVFNKNVDYFLTAYFDMSAHHIKRATQEVQNYATSDTDFTNIIHFLTTRGLTLDYIKGLTPSQLIFILSKIEGTDQKFTSFEEVNAFLAVAKENVKGGE